jgi:hypothetical protein
MITNYVELFLSKDPYYTYRQTLDGKDFIFTFRYSTREACWYMDLYDADKTPLVLGTKLVPSYPMFEDLVLADIDGFFWLSANLPSNIDKFYTAPRDLPDFFTLRYFYEA